MAVPLQNGRIYREIDTDAGAIDAAFQTNDEFGLPLHDEMLDCPYGQALVRRIQTIQREERLNVMGAILSDPEVLRYAKTHKGGMGNPCKPCKQFRANRDRTRAVLAKQRARSQEEASVD